MENSGSQIVAENSHICSLDHSRLATRCCVCAFPPIVLCVECSVKHGAAPGFHYLLPLTALDVVSVKEAWKREKTHLLQLQSAQGEAVESLSLLQTLPERIESAFQEVIDHLNDVKYRLLHEFHELEAELQKELSAAVQETTQNAVNSQYVPSSELTARIWNCAACGADFGNVVEFEIRPDLTKAEESINVAWKPSLSTLQHLTKGQISPEDRINAQIATIQNEAVQTLQAMQEHAKALESSLEQAFADLHRERSYSDKLKQVLETLEQAFPTAIETFELVGRKEFRLKPNYLEVGHDALNEVPLRRSNTECIRSSQLSEPMKIRSGLSLAALKDGTSVRIYDCEASSWSNPTEFASVPSDLYSFAAFLPDDSLLFCGGGQKPVLKTVFRLIGKRTQTLQGMKVARGMHGGIVLNNVLYVFGGYDPTGPNCQLASCEKLTLDENLPAQEWAKLPNMLTPRYSFNPCTDGRFIYICGGWETKKSEFFYPVTSSFQSLDFELPESSPSCSFFRDCELTILTKSSMSQIRRPDVQSQIETTPFKVYWETDRGVYGSMNAICLGDYLYKPYDGKIDKLNLRTGEVEIKSPPTPESCTVS